MKFPQRINKIMPRVLKEMHIEKKVHNWIIIDKWTEIVGKRIAQHAQAVGVDAENLYVEVDNPMWQSQLFIMKSMIINKCRKYDIELKDIKFSIVPYNDARSTNGKKN